LNINFELAYIQPSHSLNYYELHGTFTCVMQKASQGFINTTQIYLKDIENIHYYPALLLEPRHTTESQLKSPWNTWYIACI